MKKFLSFFAMAAIALTFAACSEDEEPNPNTTNQEPLTMTEKVAGDYGCNISVMLNNQPLAPSENTVTIEAVDDINVNFVLKDFKVDLGGQTITPTNENGEAKITLTNVTLSETDGKINFAAEQTPNLVVAAGAPAIPVPINANGTFSNDSLSAQINIELSPLEISVTVEGQK